MPYLAVCRDDSAANASELRQVHRDDHFAYIESIIDRLLIAGPAGGKSNADFGFSVFIYDTDERLEAERLLFGDPYYRCGLYGDVELEPFIPAAGRWIGGTTW